jgi:cellulose biosynthesis protein BcsQ
VEDAAIHAVVVPTAGTVAYNLAGLFARAGKDQGRRVLLVDAEGHATQKILAGVGEPPDELVVNGGNLGKFVAFDPHSNLGVLLHPISDGLPAARVIALASREADLVVVACAPTMYADDWLRAADAVVATDKDARSLAEILERAEEVRGRNGTLLAPMGRPKLTTDLRARRVFRLPSRSCAAFREAEESGAFAALKDAEVGRAFRPLLEELLQVTRKEVV